MWADILLLAIVLLFLALLYLIARKIWLTWTCSLDEPETYGDNGGHPYREIPLKLTPDQKRRLRTVVDRMAATPAPETGSGLLPTDWWWTKPGGYG